MKCAQKFKALFLAGLVAAAFGAGSCGADAYEARTLNVLFIAVDDLRPELGCYGNKVVKSPNIDRLAARGMVFTSAYCQQAVCSPSRSSLLTGRYPDATRVWDLKTHFRAALPNAATLPQLFKQNGYYCASLSKIYHHGFEDGLSWSEPAWFPSGLTVDTDLQDFRKRKVARFGPGVREYSNDGEDNDAASKRVGKARRKASFEASTKMDDELPDGATAAEAVRRLHDYKQSNRPFFLAVGFLKPHLPFVAPKKYWDLYDPAKIPVPAIDHLPEGAPAIAGHDNGELHAYGNVPAGNPIPQDLARQLRHGYYACVSYMDDQVGRVLDALKKEGLADNTVIVLWGDHGWQLGDHGLWAKHTNYELATRAPMIIALPGQKTAGKHCSAPVEFVDIYPTLAAACGLNVPSGLDGVSLMPLLFDPSSSVRKVAMSQYPRGGSGAGGNIMGYSIRDEQWRLTVWRDRRSDTVVATELYDEKNDPAETVSLAEKHSEVVKRLAVFLPALPPWKETAAGTSSTVTRAGAKGGAGKAPQDRAEMFKRKDRNQNGELSLDEFIAYQPDQEAARKRFEKWDTDKNGRLSEAEFVEMGKAK